MVLSPFIAYFTTYFIKVCNKSLALFVAPRKSFSSSYNQWGEKVSHPRRLATEHLSRQCEESCKLEGCSADLPSACHASQRDGGV